MKQSRINLTTEISQGFQGAGEKESERDKPGEYPVAAEQRKARGRDRGVPGYRTQYGEPDKAEVFAGRHRSGAQGGAAVRAA